MHVLVHSFLVASSSTSHHLAQNAFSSVGVPLSRLRASAAQLLFNLCMEAPEKMMATLSQCEDVWELQAADGDMDSLRENMLPQSNITQVTLLPLMMSRSIHLEVAPLLSSLRLANICCRWYKNSKDLHRAMPCPTWFS
jgi:hypothetical protein